MEMERQTQPHMAFWFSQPAVHEAGLAVFPVYEMPP